MRTAIELADNLLAIQVDGTTRIVVDDLAVTAWGETHRWARGGLELGPPVRDTSADEVDSHEQVRLPFVTRSLRQPTEWALGVRCYESEPVVMVEWLPAVGRPVFGTEEAASLRLRSLPGCRRAVYVHQRVSEYGRDAVGAWWAQARPLDDPTRDNPYDWGLGTAWRTSDGVCGVLLPLRAGGAVARLRGAGRGLDVVASGWCGRHVYPRLPGFLAAFDPDPRAALDRAYRAASGLCEWSFRLRDDKEFPAPFEQLGYSTWGAFGPDIEQARVIEAVAGLRDQDVPLGWVLLDEGWQQVDAAGRLTGFGADPQRFPAGLPELVQRLRGAGGLRHVGVWTTLQGSWAGLPGDRGWVDENPDHFYVGVDGTVVPDPGPLGRHFWDDCFAELSGAGVSFVKVDNQGSLRNLYLGRLALDDAAGASIDSVEQAAEQADLGLGAGMSLQPECLYHYAATNVVRVTPDLLASDPAAVKQHLAQSVRVGSWVSRIAWPDFDAFPSEHPAARALAVMAALSGGPVALNDRPGEHDTELIRRLVLRDGRLLLPAAPADPPAARFFDDPLTDAPLIAVGRPGRLPRRAPLAGLREKAAPPDAALIGLANVRLDGEPVEVALPLGELDLPAADAYAVTTHFAGGRFTLAGDAAIELTLGELDAELVTVVPVLDGRALLGLPDKLLGLCGCAWDEDDQVSLPEPGEVLLYDEGERLPASTGHEPFPLVEIAGRIGVGQAWRDGPWLTVHSPSTLFRMIPG